MKAISSYLDSHFKESFTIHEAGMKLIPEHSSRIRARLESLESRAPAFSAIQLKFTNGDDTVEGELSISGAGKNFRSSVKGQSPWEIYKSLEKEIDKQLLRWKRTRFMDKYVSVPISGNGKRTSGGYAA